VPAPWYYWACLLNLLHFGREVTVLILTRQLGEKIIIGEGPDRVTVELVYMDRCKVKLGITAPKSVPVHREEIYLLLKEQSHAEDNQDESKSEGAGH
jgi:carbon storage regulator